MQGQANVFKTTQVGLVIEPTRVRFATKSIRHDCYSRRTGRPRPGQRTSQQALRGQAQRSLEHFNIGGDLIPCQMIPA
jgi:hypothetical protein